MECVAGGRLFFAEVAFSPEAVSPMVEGGVGVGGDSALAEFAEGRFEGVDVRVSRTPSTAVEALRGITACPYSDAARRIYIEAKAMEILALHLAEPTEKAEPGRMPLRPDGIERVRAAKGILDGRIEDPPSLMELCRMVGLNDFKLKAGFKEVFGATAFGYLHERRMERARRHVEAGEMNVGEVALAVGYASQGCFAAAFKKRYGIRTSSLLPHRNGSRTRPRPPPRKPIAAKRIPEEHTKIRGEEKHMKKAIEVPGFIPPGIEDITRRDFLVGGAAAILLGGCGSDEQAESSGETRIVRHALGETEVPVSPGRIVSLEPVTTTETLLAPGVTPVGSVTFVGSPISEELQARAEEEIEDLGNITEPNLERIAALEPDLIVDSIVPTEDLREQASRIAQTVAAPFGDEEWKEQVRIIADAVGRSEQAEEALTDYENRVEGMVETLGGGASGIEASVVRIGESAADGVRAYVKSSFAESILEDVGFSRPQSQNVVQETWNIDVSLEQLGKVDGDVMFAFTVSAGEAEEFFEELREDPLWERLEVVREDMVYEVGDYWSAAGSLIAANLILDDLEENLLENGG